VCGNTQNNKNYVVKEMMLGFEDSFAYFECSCCGCLQIQSVPENLSKYYPPSYYSFENIEEKFYAKAVKGSIFYWLLFQSKLGSLFPYTQKIFPEKALHFRTVALNASPLLKLPLNRNSRILEVGCGSGILLYVLKNLGFRNVLGCDPYIESDINYGNGLQIRKACLEDIGGKWDLVAFYHSFEHLTNPLETLRTTSGLLSQDGACLINMPTVSSYAWRHYGVNWVQLDAPRHLYIHSVKSMKMLAEQAGFALRNIQFTSSAFQFLGSEQYLKGISLKDANSFFENPIQSIFSKRQVAVYAKKAARLNSEMQGDSVAYFLNPKS
jgi:hypothetical protein